MTLTVVGPVQTRTSRVLWLLEELGTPYAHEIEMPHSDAVAKLNTLKQVPILKTSTEVLTDSLAILHFLADGAEKFTFPPGSTQRAIMDARINFVLTEIEAPLWLRSRHTYVLPEDLQRPEAVAIAEEDLRRAEVKFADLLGDNKFFGGPIFTIADIIAGHCAGWALGTGMVDRDGPLSAYFARMKARPAWVRSRANLEK